MSFALRFLVLALGARALASAPQPPRRAVPADRGAESESPARELLETLPLPSERIRSGRLALLQAAASTRIWTRGDDRQKFR